MLLPTSVVVVDSGIFVATWCNWWKVCEEPDTGGVSWVNELNGPEPISQC